MEARETKFQRIIEGTNQYIVPLFQRAYSWDKKEWEILWDDLMDLCDKKNKNHFFGSIVTVPDKSVPEGVTKYLLIDGQQRLTTIFILLALLRDSAKSNGNERLSNEINDMMLVNPYKEGDDYFKLIPTQVDRDLFKKLIRQKPLSDQSQLYNCYQFFERKIKKERIEIQTLKEVIINRLSVVSIVLDNDDNPHLVFESLNAKGRVLTQSDLIRNYFFMRISIDKQDEIYKEYWEPMQRELGGIRLTECIRHYLMRDGTMVKQGDVYFTLKERIEQNDALESLIDITVFAEYYKKLLNPEKEPDTDISNALKRINKLEVTTAYPFLLSCYHDYYIEQISADDFVKILNIIENFIIRRFVCNIPTNQLNKIFPLLYVQAKAENSISLADGVCKVLQKRGYPSDIEFRARLKDSRLYGSGERARRVKLILETLENAYQHKEKLSFEELTIEHIMPQTLTEWWRDHLGENCVADHDIYLHTLGNLTLSAYNSELSNDTFAQKKNRFIESHLELNHYFKDIDRWTKSEIERRSEALYDLALRVWSYFGDNQLTQINNDSVTGKKPKILTFYGFQIVVNSWREVLEETLFNIYDALEDSEFLSILAKEYSNFISSDPKQLRQPQRLYQNSDYYFETNLSAKQIYNFCINAIESIGWSAEEWKVETD